MGKDYINFKKALICSVAFCGIYVAVYGAQNTQTEIFELNGYESVGYY